MSADLHKKLSVKVVLIGRGRDGHHGQWSNPIRRGLVALSSRSGLTRSGFRIMAVVKPSEHV